LPSQGWYGDAEEQRDADAELRLGDAFEAAAVCLFGASIDLGRICGETVERSLDVARRHRTCRDVDAGGPPTPEPVLLVRREVFVAEPELGELIEGERQR
jgi:hypothetical protein